MIQASTVTSNGAFNQYQTHLHGQAQMAQVQAQAQQMAYGSKGSHVVASRDQNAKQKCFSQKTKTKNIIPKGMTNITAQNITSGCL